MSQPDFVSFEGVGVTYGSGKDATEALCPTDLTIAKGDFVAFVGPSGCGKSTILKLVSELMKPSQGHIFFGGRELGAKPVRVGMAFQSASLLPWMTVRDNVMLPLKIVEPFKASFRAKRQGEYRARVDALLDQVGLLEFADKSPWQLSGGMMQRANLCRALVHDPDLLLLDEPFGALDQFTREELWQTLQALWIERKSTVLLVTHDLREAAYLANRIYVMSARPGRILDTCPVNFARPRPIEVTFEAPFVQLTQELRRQIVHAPARNKADAA
ncbi:MAG: ABC transporter ATP-binding protein [Pseudomonadota bacterium]